MMRSMSSIGRELPPEGAEVEWLRYDDRGCRRTAGIEDENGRQTLTGTVMLIGDVPTPARPIAAGDVVSPEDLDLRQDRSADDASTDRADGRGCL